MREVVFSPAAQADFIEISEYIAARSERAAQRFIERFEEALGKLAAMPGLGHRRNDVADDRYRFWVIRPYVLACRFDDAALVVVRIMHGYRDFRRIFPSRESG